MANTMVQYHCKSSAGLWLSSCRMNSAKSMVKYHIHVVVWQLTIIPIQALGWIIPNASSWANNTKCHIHVLARLMYSRHSLELFDEWCQNHGEIPYSHHSLELGHCQDDGEILYSGHSLATMRTVQNSKTLAGNISMLYHWLWVTVGLGDHIYKSTTYSKNFCRVSSKYSQSVIIFKAQLCIWDSSFYYSTVHLIY